MTSDRPVIQCHDICKSFARKAESVDALCQVSLAVQPCEFVAIRGPSGCGKSTLMLAMGGLQRPDSGRIVIQEQDLYKLNADQRSAFRARHIGFVFQQFHLIPYLNVRENVLSATLGIGATNEQATRADELISQVGLSDRADHKPAELSTGECQRVAIARAMLNQPALMLADEPTGNLDPDNTDSVLSLLQTISRDGTAVVMVTHDVQCDDHVDRIVHMKSGQIADG